jgi:hypothetical protein
MRRSDCFRQTGCHAAVEREFGRLKHDYRLSPLRVRGLARVALHASAFVLQARLAGHDVSRFPPNGGLVDCKLSPKPPAPAPQLANRVSKTLRVRAR